MALVYIGTSQFAADLLTLLSERGIEPELVVSRPDAPKGRGRTLSPPPVAELAIARGFELIQPEDVGEPSVANRVAEVAGPGGHVVLCAYGALIKGQLLDQQPILNVHPSLLPRWRGAAPIERAIQSTGEGEFRGGECAFVAGKGLGGITVDVARELVEHDHPGERAVGIDAPVAEASRECLRHHGAEAFADGRIEGRVLAEPLGPRAAMRRRARRTEPEIEYRPRDVVHPRMIRKRRFPSRHQIGPP